MAETIECPICGKPTEPATAGYTPDPADELRDVIAAKIREANFGWRGGSDEEYYHALADAALVALAAAGRLHDADVEVQWSISWPEDGVDGHLRSEQDARATAARYRFATAVRRSVGPWLPVPDTEGGGRE